MQIGQTWAALVAEIRTASDPYGSRATSRLYDVALKDGVAALARFRGLDSDERGDLVRDVFTEKLRAIVGHGVDNPRILFLVAVQRRAIDRTRRLRVRQEGAAVLRDEAAQQQELASGEDHRLTAIDARRALAGLSERDRDILLLVFAGEDRDEVARRFGTTRANVDQKISRFRKRLRGEEP